VFTRRDRLANRLPVWFSLLLWFFTALLTTLLIAGLVNAREEPKPKPQPWQISGIEAALEDERSVVKDLALSEFSDYEAQTVKKSKTPSF
jgi:hypothetical protein